MLQLPTYAWSQYRARIRDEHAAGWITRAERDALVAIANLHFAGEFEPTVARIALEAACDPRTVRRATARARERGILCVEARFERMSGRRRQQANRYGLLVPDGPVCARPKGGQNARPSGKRIKKEGLRAPSRSTPGVSEPAGRTDLLAARRAAFGAASRAARHSARTLPG